MPYNKKPGGDKKRGDGYKSGNKPVGSFKKDRPAKSKNSEFNTFDDDELAPPRFLAPKKNTYKPDSGGRKFDKPFKKSEDKYPKRSDSKSFDGRKSDFKKPDFKRSDSKRDDFKRGDVKRDGFKRDDFKKSDSRRDDKRGEFKKDDFKRSDSRRDDRRGDFKKDDFKKRDFKKPAFDSSSRDRRSKDDELDGQKKKFRPKFDPEIKVKKSFRERKAELVGPEIDKGDLRLNRYLANSGICSRREADEIIKQGLVTVNNNVVTEMGFKVKREDIVKYDGRKIIPEPFVYILMNKPKDFITTTEDDKGRKTVMDLLADKIPQRVYPIGRLDRNTTGVLLLTNDGEVSQALTHPSFQIKKVYHVVLNNKVSGTDLDKLVEGVELEDGVVHADAVSFVESEDRRHVGIEIHSGKNRVVRRMFEALGYDVEKLDRVSMGIFTKKDLPRGKWRHLTQSEVGFLMKLKSKM